jgi:hypothetical protein
MQGYCRRLSSWMLNVHAFQISVLAFLAAWRHGDFDHCSLR